MAVLAAQAAAGRGRSVAKVAGLWAAGRVVALSLDVILPKTIHARPAAVVATVVAVAMEVKGLAGARP